MSVPNTWIGVLLARSPRYSKSTIATEYASSPVEQPGIQTRMASPLGLLSRIFGRNTSLSASNESGSRKKPVT
jgi:hypothetical protein